MSLDVSIPSGWAKIQLDSLVHLVNGYAFKPTQWQTEGLPIIRIQNLNNPNSSYNCFPAEGLPGKFRVAQGELLFAWSGTPGTSFGAHIWRGDDAWLNQHIFKLEFDKEKLDAKFLRLAINQNLESYIRQSHGGAGLAHITKRKFESSELLIAPLAEQRRIVAKIEELFSELDAGVAALKRAKANLKRYRASVLKAAVEGKLTEEWRAKHPAKETASQLLDRILKERRQKWEADQLAKFAAANKQPPKNWQAKYVESSPPDTTGLPQLRKGWCWSSAEQLADMCLGKMLDKSKHIIGTKLPYLRNVNVRWQSFDLNDLSDMYFTDQEVDRYSIQEGDLLVCEGGEPGRASVWRNRTSSMRFQKALHRVRCHESIRPEFIAFYLARLFPFQAAWVSP